MKKIIFFLIFHIPVLSQWQPDFRLTNAQQSSYTCFNSARSMVTDAINRIHVVWFDLRDGNINDPDVNIYYKRSTNNGTNWSADIRLTDDPNFSYDPAIAISGTYLHVVWYDTRNGYYEIYYKRSSNEGTDWGPDTRLTNYTEDSYEPSLYAIGSAVHLVWSDWRDRNWEIYYKRSVNYGSSWTSDIRLTNSAGFSEHPMIVASNSGNIIHVVWQDSRDDPANHTYEIYYKRSTDGGVTWSSDTRLTNSPNNSRWPCIVLWGSVLHLVWTDARNGNNDIYYKKSTNDGASWGADIRLTTNTSHQIQPSIALSYTGGTIVHIVWDDWRHGNNNRQVYYIKSVDAGTNWGPEERLTNSTAIIENPCVAVAFQTVHVVWTDWRHDNVEIYYKRNPTGNTTAIETISTEIPDKFALYQNFPNPFNPETKIKFDISLFNNVKILIYDILGREIETIIDQSLNPGTYELSFNASDLPSGIYYYRLVTNDFSETRKMTLIR